MAAGKVSIERLRELLSYNPETGLLHWRVKCRGYTNAGDEAGGSTISGGYRKVQVKVKGMSPCDCMGYNSWYMACWGDRSS